jgi:hypothetical protein
MKNEVEFALTDRALKLNGVALQTLRHSAKRWFFVAVTLILIGFIALPFSAENKVGFWAVGLGVGALVPVLFNAGRLAGKVEALDQFRRSQTR